MTPAQRKAKHRTLRELQLRLVADAHYELRHEILMLPEGAERSRLFQLVTALGEELSRL
jgi:hypothetical protein